MTGDAYLRTDFSACQSVSQSCLCAACVCAWCLFCEGPLHILSFKRSPGDTIEEARSAPKAGPPPSKPPWGVATPWHLDVDGRPFPDKAPDASQFATQMWRSASFACSRVVAHARSCLLFDSCVEACNSDARVATVAAVAVASVVGVALGRSLR